jgi:hypothetical protein
MRHLFFICLTLVISASRTYGLSSDEILEKVDQFRAPSKSFTFRLNLKSTREERFSSAELFVRIKDAKKSLIVYTAPPSMKGRVVLMVEDNMWIFIPGTRNPIRISPQQQLMGQVSTADVARVVYHLDYKADSAEEAIVEQEKMLKLNLSAKTQGAAYSAIELFVNPLNYAPIKAEFYALSGRHLKSATYKNYQSILGKSRPTLLEIHDHVQKSDVSLLEYWEIKEADTPDEYFQKSFMERVSRF